jgi:hypothetical protein
MAPSGSQRTMKAARAPILPNQRLAGFFRRSSTFILPSRSKRKNGEGEGSRTQRRKQNDIKSEKAMRPGSSFEFPGRRIFRALNYATSRFADCRKASRGRSSVVPARHESSPFFGGLSKLGQIALRLCSPIGSPTNRGLALLRDADSTT